jgi:signal transduction histidine kinase
VKRFLIRHFRPTHVRFLIPFGCILLTCFVGYLDYVSGFENSMLLFYLAPIAIATWYCGIGWGGLIALLSVIASLISDVAAGIPQLSIWNLSCEFAAYLVFLFLLARWHELLSKMQSRVEEKTAALQQELATRRRLEKEISVVAEQERERVGRELHDSLCQHLVGTSLLAQTVAVQADQLNPSIGEKAYKVANLVNKGVELSREIARGLLSFELDTDLLDALDGLARSITYERKIECRFESEVDIPISREIANHLYWIAREAVINSAKHAGATRILIRLDRPGKGLRLTIMDDGAGIKTLHSNDSGIGMKVMRQRAHLTGGSLTISPNSPRGTLICCEVPITSSDGRFGT